MVLTIDDIEDLPEASSADGADWFLVVIDDVLYKIAPTVALGDYVPDTRIVGTGEGLTGGGNLSEDRLLYIPPEGIHYELLALSGVTPQTVGDPTHIPVLTVDDKGRVTAITTATPAVSGYVLQTITVTGTGGLTGGGTLNVNRTITLVGSVATPTSLGVAAPGTSVIVSHEDHVHGAVNLADATQISNVLGTVAGGTGTSLHANSGNAGAVLYVDTSGFQISDVGTEGYVLTSNGSDAPTWEPGGTSGPAAAGTLTGTTLASNVVNSSLTSVGTLTNLIVSGSIGTTGSRIFKIWATDAQVTNPIVGSITGNAGTATILQNSRTINGVPFNGSANITIPSGSANALTIGEGLLGTSYDGTLAVTIAIDNDVVVTLNGAQEITNKSFSDNSNYFVNWADATKRAQFLVDEVSTGTTRQLSVQNTNGIVALLENTLDQFASTNVSDLAENLSSATDGQLFIGKSDGSMSVANLTEGSNISIVNGNGTITISSTGGGGGLTWNDVTGTTQTISPDNGYTANNASLVLFTLPSTCVYGKTFSVAYKGTGGWKIAQNAGQQIICGNRQTTAGTGGYIQSTDSGDVVTLLCTTANTTFTILSSTGNITEI